MTIVSDPALDEKLAEERRQRLFDLLQQIGDQVEAGGLPGQRTGRREGFRLAYYPPFEIDKEVVEWFARRTGHRMATSFAINRVLIDYIDAWEREHEKKAG